jgi:TonB family protein
MNRAILYRPNARWQPWTAFACAAAIHVVAVRMSAGKANPPPMTGPSGSTVIDATTEIDDAPPPIDIPAPEPAVLPDVATEFRESVARETRQVTRVQPLVARPMPGTTRSASFRSLKAMAVFAPRPDYPYEARRRGMVGSGAAGLTIDPGSGAVLQAQMSQTTGSPLLDGTTLSTLRRWRFKPGTPPRVEVPITFTLSGASY